MQKLFISATVNVDDSLNGLEQSNRVLAALEALGYIESLKVSAIKYRPKAQLDATVWVYRSSDEEEPFVLVQKPYELEGFELSEEQVNRLMEEGVCTSMRAYYPNAGRYGAPVWATDPAGPQAAMAAAKEGFYIAEEGFVAFSKDTRDDSAESYWFEVAVPGSSELLSLVHSLALVADEEDEEDVDSTAMQALCDRIRRNLTEEEMKDALEGAGFAISETGQELIEALAEAIHAGDVDELILD